MTLLFASTLEGSYHIFNSRITEPALKIIIYVL